MSEEVKTEKTLYYEGLDRAKAFSLEVDGPELKGLLGNKHLQSALRTIMLDAGDIGNALLTANLGTEEGLKAALKMQGRASGILAVIDRLLDMAGLSEENKDATS